MFSFEKLVNELEKKSDLELHGFIIDAYDTITVSFSQSYQNGIQMGSIVVLGGLQAAFDQLDDIPSEKYAIGQELFGDIVDSEDDLKYLLHGYNEEMEEAVCKMVSLFNNEEFQRCVIEYMLSLALYGKKNPSGIKNINRIFDAVFSIADIFSIDDLETDEWPDVEDCQEELDYMIESFSKMDTTKLFSILKNDECFEEYESLVSEEDFSIIDFLKELLDNYLGDGGLAITGFDGFYTPGNMELFKPFFDKEMKGLLEE